MKTLFDCLDTAVSGKLLTKKQADKLKDDYRRFRASHQNTARGAADQLAKNDLLAALEAEAKHKRRKAKLTVTAVQRIMADSTAYRTASGKADIGAAFLDHLEHYGAPFNSVHGQQTAIVGMAHAKMEGVLHHFRRGAFAGDKKRWNVADMRNVLREAFGEDTGDAAAKGLARAWTETAEWLRQRFNAAGGAIGKLENWGLPQWHDARALRNVSLQTWKEAIRPRLDIRRMRHPLTGKAIGDNELDGILDEVYATVTTEGWINRKPAAQPAGRGALANQRADHRFLVFKTPDDWLAYQKDFGGGGDVFAAMMGHINGMAKDIAAMDVLGPNPSGTVNLMKQTLAKQAHKAAAAGDKKALDRAAYHSKRLDAVWGSLRGALETPVNSKWANGLAAARSLITASILGQAALSSISDVGTSIIARRFAGLPAHNAIPQIVTAFSQSTRREAVQAGLILDNAMHTFHAQARYVGTLQGPEWASYIADRVLTYSGLIAWTQAAKHAFGLAFQTELGNHAGKALGEMPQALGDTLRRWGFTDRQWDLMRQVPLHENQLLRPAEIAERIDDKLALKYLQMVQGETEYAVPNGAHRSRTMVLDENQPGTVTGEALRSFFQFKSFGAVFVFLHGRRMHQMLASGDKLGGAAYAGSLLLSTTLFGGAALMLKDIAAGKEPRQPGDDKFWAAAMLQGGGLGIYGDFLFSNVNRYGGGFSTTLGGPLVERASNFWDLTAGNAIQLASGEKTYFGRELVRFAKGNIPGGNIWYLRLAFERVAIDQAMYLADPQANKAFKRQQQKLQRETGRAYYWAPGQLTPGK